MFFGQLNVGPTLAFRNSSVVLNVWVKLPLFPQRAKNYEAIITSKIKYENYETISKAKKSFNS